MIFEDARASRTKLKTANPWERGLIPREVAFLGAIWLGITSGAREKDQRRPNRVTAANSGPGITEEEPAGLPAKNAIA